MKKIYYLLALLLIASTSYAASSATQAVVKLNGGLRMLEIFAVCDSDGSFSSWNTKEINGAVTYADTIPVSAPTANYDITLKNSDGLDIFGTALSNRSATTPERARPLNNGNDTWVPNLGPLTLDIANNTATTAEVTIKVWWYE